MKPYYADDHVTLYHARWEDVPPELLRADVLVTDPPYGYNHASNRDDSPWQNAPIEGDKDLTSRDGLLAWWTGPALVFGSWKMPPPAAARTALVWDKGLASGMGDLSMPWKPNWEMVYVLGSGFAGRRDSGVITGYNVVTWASKGRVHPNEKPVGLMRDLLAKCPEGTILDPYAGSGTTLVAAKSLNRKAIGVECVEAYCEVAADRLRQEVLGLVA